MGINIELPATLTAEYSQYDENWDQIEGPGIVIVRFGNIEITRLPAAREAGGYYDQHMDGESEKSVAAETVAVWLREKLA